MCVLPAHGAAQLRIIVQFDAQTAEGDAEKSGGVSAVSVAAHERIENMSSLDLG